MTPPHRSLPALTALLCASTACGHDTGSGDLSILLESEDVIVDGLDPGDGVANIQDGWSVRFDAYAVAIGDVDLHLSTDESIVARAHEVFVVDLTEVPATGLPLWSLGQLSEGRWEFNYTTPGAGDGSTRHDSTTESDYDEMVANDWTYFVEGTLAKDDGQSCPPAALASAGASVPNGNVSGGNDCYDAPEIRFVFGANAETAFGPCEVDDVPGVTVSSGRTQTVTVTIHGDHLFFNGFPEGAEGGTIRLAQWLADCDLNLDGTVTQDELEAIAPSQLSELDNRYQLGGSPITPLDDMYDYVIGQLKTQGHFQGEGECPFDGVVHDH